MEPEPQDSKEPVGWMIWQAPGRGYVTLESDLPLIADALEALWSLRAQRQEMELLAGLAGARHARPATECLT